MNRKVIALVALILVLVVIGIIVGINISKNNENSSTGQNQASKNQLNNREEVGQSTNNETNKEENNQENGNENVLVLYFSMSGNTQAVANEIHDAVGGDIVRLETEQTYPSDYNDLVDYAQEEQRENARPVLSTVIDNIEQYDTIFLGYPNWWGDMPMPIYTFLDEYDLSGKIIAPFITHGGSGLSGTPQNIQNEEPNATVRDGLAVRDSNSQNAQSAVNEWLSEIGF